jgi:hypothetical protein
VLPPLVAPVHFVSLKTLSHRFLSLKMLSHRFLRKSENVVAQITFWSVNATNDFLSCDKNLSCFYIILVSPNIFCFVFFLV